jgi:hypothetical protein
MKKKIDPFKIKKTRNKDDIESIKPPPEVAVAVDRFNASHELVRHHMSELSVQREIIMNYALDTHSQRLTDEDKNRSFKILGVEKTVTFVAVDGSGQITGDELAEFQTEWGKAAAKTLIVKDWNNVRVNGEVLVKNFDVIMKVLEKLPPKILQNLFWPISLKAVKGAVDKAKPWAKSSDKMRRIIEQLKLRNYIK